ncbi:MAG: SpoIIIAH-like family protein [Clostridia bacterium]|nr:SpoIIIAH-like family protein [Clostridia bacterium]
MTKKKKILIIAGFCLLLALTGVLNIVLNTSAKTTATDVVATTSFFNSYRQDRTDTYEQEMLYLSAIIESSSSSAEAKANAEAEQAKIIANMKLQTNLEGLIKSKGFADVVVSAMTNNISVIVKSATLTDAEVASIVDVIHGETNYTIDNIKIIHVE